MPVLHDGPNLRITKTPEGLFKVDVSEEGDEQGIEGPQRPDVEAILQTIQKHLEANAPVHYLIGLAGVSDLTLAERWQIASRMRENRKYIERSALYGLSRQLEFAFRVIIRVSGRTDLRVFRTQDEARQWLLEELQAVGSGDATD
jgi:hypothetical protein